MIHRKPHIKRNLHLLRDVVTENVRAVHKERIRLLKRPENSTGAQEHLQEYHPPYLHVSISDIGRARARLVGGAVWKEF